MQHLQYGNYDLRYMVYVRKMADINNKYKVEFSNQETFTIEPNTLLSLINL